MVPRSRESNTPGLVGTSLTGAPVRNQSHSSLRSNRATEYTGSRVHFPYIVAASITVYWSFVSLIPIYNKHFFHKDQYPYPVASAGIQLGIVAITLSVLSVVLHSVSVGFGRSETRTDPNNEPNRRSSWIFGPGILYKITWTAPIGVLFGLKYGVTNLGLALLPAPTHLLLQSTDLIWTCLAAWFIKDERLNWVGYACIAGCVVGSAITSYTAVQHYGEENKGGAFDGASWWAIIVNLSSPVLLGLCITTLRVACKRLLPPNNPHLGGTSMNSFELTCWKLWMSSSVALMLACVMEPETLWEDTEGVIHVKDDWLTAFGKLSEFTKLGVMGGSFLILVFQVNCTFLTGLTSAYAVGLVGQLKIIPQWVTAALIAPSASFHLYIGNVVGAIITMIAAAVFAVYNYTSNTSRTTQSHPSETKESSLSEKTALLGAHRDDLDAAENGSTSACDLDERLVADDFAQQPGMKSYQLDPY